MDEPYFSWQRLFYWCLVWALILHWAPCALAETTAEWYKSLTRNDTHTSCCDISDCKRTEAEWHGGRWYARVPDPTGPWTPIPEGKVLRYTTSPDGQAVVCSTPDIIYCFVPPDRGY